jgi:hypothetical protein
MRNRRTVIAIFALVAVILLGLFVVFGLPLIQDMFTPPITGMPTAPAGNSLQARFTQTAQAKQSGTGGTQVPTP